MEACWCKIMSALCAIRWFVRLFTAHEPGAMGNAGNLSRQ